MRIFIEPSFIKINNIGLLKCILQGNAEGAQEYKYDPEYINKLNESKQNEEEELETRLEREISEKLNKGKKDGN